ncbi:MAG: ATP-binding cassette domain-containing protein [Phycisphaerales bacterium]
MSEVELQNFRAAWSPLDQCGEAGRVTALIPGGSCVGVVGQNGVGKSTFLRGLAGTAPFMQGRVLVDKRPLEDVTDRFAMGIKLVSQEGPWSIGDLSTKEARDLASFRRRSPCAADDKAEEVEACFRAKGWLHQERASPRVFELLAAVLSSPKVLILDEILPALPPASSRDQSCYQALQQLLPRTTLLIVDHNIEHLAAVSTSVIELSDTSRSNLINAGNTAAWNQLRQRYAYQGAAPPRDDPDKAPWLSVVDPHQSVRSQVKLAAKARCAPGHRTDLCEKIWRDFPFLKQEKPARELSGGQRIVLAFVMATVGMDGSIPDVLLRHLSGVNQQLTAEWSRRVAEMKKNGNWSN